MVTFITKKRISNGTGQKWSFPLSLSSRNTEEITEDILNGKLHFLCSAGWASRFGWEVNIRSIQDKKFVKKSVGSFVTYVRPWQDLRDSICKSSGDDFSCTHHLDSLALKSPGIHTKRGFLDVIKT